MKAPLTTAKRLKEWEKEDFLADAELTVNLWDDGSSTGQLEYDYSGPFITITDSDGETINFRAWRINNEIHADFAEPGFSEMSDEEFTLIYN